MLLQEIVRFEIKQQASFCALFVCGLKAEPSGVHYHQIFIFYFFYPNQSPGTYLMAFFSPRPRAESGVSAVSTPGLFLFPLSQAEGGDDREKAGKQKVSLDLSFEAVFLLY